MHRKNITADSPHVDQILSQCNRIGIAANGDSSIGIATLALLAIADPNHGPGYLAYLGDFSAALANNAPDQIIWHRHLMLLRIGLRPICCCTQLRASECGESCEKEESE